MTLWGAKTIFLDTWYATIEKTLRKQWFVYYCKKRRVHSHSSLNVINVNFIACFWIICLFLQTLNFKGNEKYVLVFVQCHDGMITNSINLFASYTRRKQIYLIRDHRFMTLDSNQNLIFKDFVALKKQWWSSQTSRTFTNPVIISRYLTFHQWCTMFGSRKFNHVFRDGIAFGFGIYITSWWGG